MVWDVGYGIGDALVLALIFMILSERMLGLSSVSFSSARDFKGLASRIRLVSHT